MTSSRRIAVAVLSAALLIGSPLLAGCGNAIENAAENAAGEAIGGDVDIEDGSITVKNSDGTTMQAGEDLAMPDTWPSEVPTYDGGKLLAVTVDDDGTSANAVWTTDADPKDVIAAYSAALTSAGYVKNEDAVVPGIESGDFAGNGWSVSIMSISTDQGTTVTAVATKS